MGTLRRAWKAVLVVSAVCAIIFSTRQSFRASVPPLSASATSRASTDTCATALIPVTIRVPGGAIHVSFAPGPFDLREEEMLTWVRRAATAVSTYYGSFPAAHTRLRIVPVEGEEGVFHGTTFGERGGFTRIPVGEHTTAGELESDWILTHEFVHLAFPDMPKRNHWIEEGLATYVEPIARAQAGQLKPARIWRDMVRDMPKGEPDVGDRGLDNTHTWARTYWGGALYCLRADVAIRQLTDNRKGLQDALRAIVAAGGTLDKQNWPLERTLRIGDQATGTTVLEQLYAEMKDEAVQVDLPYVWKEMGVAVHEGKVNFDDHADWALARIAITQPRPMQPVQISSELSGQTTDDRGDAAPSSRFP